MLSLQGRGARTAVLPTFAEGHDCVVAYEHTYRTRRGPSAFPATRLPVLLKPHHLAALQSSLSLRTPCTTLRRYDSAQYIHAGATANSSQAHVEAPAPPPAATADTPHHHHHHHHHHDIHASPPPDYPPPSYSATAPLLAGAPPGYGTTFPDQSSIATSELEDAETSFPEWVGQALVVFVFIAITYGFWCIINTPDRPGGSPG
jgi:hypothetical protein